MADKSTTQVVGIGSVNLNVRIGKTENSIPMDNVLCVPRLRTNLLSVSRITNKGYNVVFTKNTAKIIEISGSSRTEETIFMV